MRAPASPENLLFKQHNLQPHEASIQKILCVDEI